MFDGSWFHVLIVENDIRNKTLYYEVIDFGKILETYKHHLKSDDRVMPRLTSEHNR